MTPARAGTTQRPRGLCYPQPMSVSLAAVEQVLQSGLPVRGAGFEFGLSPKQRLEVQEDGGLHAWLEVTIHDEGGGLLDVKSQGLVLVPGEVPEARGLAFLRAWCAALPVLLEDHDGSTMLPMDVCYPQALRDSSLQSEEEFTRALRDPRARERWFEAEQEAALRELLAPAGLQEQWREFRALRRPAVALAWPEPEEPEERDERVGATRLGGTPDLPHAFPWPAHQGRPMTFAAQLQLEDFRGMSAAAELPRGGLLTFFYDPFPQRAPGAPMRFPCFVHWFAPSVTLVRRETPEGGDERPALRVAPEALPDTIPPAESPFYEALLPFERALEFRKSLAEGTLREDPLLPLTSRLVSFTVEGDEYAHRVLGYAKPYQGDPYLEAELGAAGKGFEGWVEGSREAVETARRARRWRLLLQLNAQHDEGLLFEQDCGFLYFLLPEEALRNQHWASVYCVLQCS